MLSVRAIYDGKSIRLLEKVDVKEPKEVIVTFLDKDFPEITSAEIYSLAEKSGAFDFLNEPEEDIYSDKDLKKHYKK